MTHSLATAALLVTLVLAALPIGRQQPRPVPGSGLQAQRGPPLIQAGAITHCRQLQDAIPFGAARVKGVSD